MPQASQGDLVTGMFCWAHSLFPTLCAKSSGNPLARDLVLQLLERYWLIVNLINDIALFVFSIRAHSDSTLIHLEIFVILTLHIVYV